MASTHTLQRNVSAVRPSRSYVDLALSLSVLIGALVLLALFPPVFQPWDSVAYSVGAEAHSTAFLSEHPLSNLTLYSIYATATALGLHIRALPLFQASNALLGSICATLLFLLCRRTRSSMMSSLGITILLVAARSFWTYAGTGEVYMAAAALEVTAYYTMFAFIDRPTRLTAAINGLSVGASVLAHRSNIVLAFAFLIVLLATIRTKRAGTRVVLWQIVSSAITLGVGYLLFALLAGAHTLRDALTWFGGYITGSSISQGVGLPLAVLQGHWSINFLWIVINTGISSLISEGFGSLSYRVVKICIELGLILSLMYSVRRVIQSRNNPYTLPYIGAILHFVMGAAVIWIGAAMSIYEPTVQKYWILLVVPFGLSLLAGLARLPGAVDTIEAENGGTRLLQRLWLRLPGTIGRTVSPSSFLVVAVAVSLAAFNFRTSVWPQHIAADQQALVAQQLARVVRPNDLLIAGSLDGAHAPYLRYRGWRDVLYLENFMAAGIATTPERVQEEMNRALARGSSVYLTSDAAINADPWISSPMMAMKTKVLERLSSRCRWTAIAQLNTTWSGMIGVSRLEAPCDIAEAGTTN